MDKVGDKSVVRERVKSMLEKAINMSLEKKISI